MKSLYSSFTTFHALQTAWKAVRAKNATGGIDGYSIAAFEKQLDDNLHALRSQLVSGTWNPEPYLNIEIPKNETEKRKLGLLCIRDKIVQQAIKTAIEPRMEKLFLNISYGYRPNKGAERAIRRTVHDLKQLKGGYIAKLDIDDFFDNINHERLFLRLKNWLQDEQTLRVIQLCIQMGQVTPQLKWNDIHKGLPQGAILSPLLANFYLHPFDQFAKAKMPLYIRYADDFVVAASTEQQVLDAITLLQEHLNEHFFLRLNQPIIRKSSEGVEFLGVIVSDQRITVTEKKKQELIERIHSIKFANAVLSAQSQKTLQGIKNYYAKLLDESTLKDFDCELMSRLHALIKRNQRYIASAKELAKDLQQIDFFSENSNRKKSQLIQQLCSTYIVYANKKREKISATSASINKDKLIKQKKKKYQKLENSGAELVVSTPGCYIGASYKNIVVRQQNKIINKGSASLRHITVIGKGISLSSNALMFCMNHKIPIDFFDGKGKQYASVLTPQFIDDTLWSKQIQLPLQRKVKLASLIVTGKMKNQLNLIKYYYKYHKDVLGSPFKQKYVESVLRIEALLEKVKQGVAVNEKYASALMAIEAQGALAYWDYIRTLLADDDIGFVRREHQGATDLLNSMLNYGYGILYGKIEGILIKVGMDPYVGIMHRDDYNRPVLVYDVIELYRVWVDYVVCSLLAQRVITDEYYSVREDGSYWLEALGRRVMIQSLNDYLAEIITVKGVSRSRLQQIFLYAQNMAQQWKKYI